MGEVGWGYKFVSNRLLKNVNKNLPSGLTYERDKRYKASKKLKGLGETNGGWGDVVLDMR